MFEALKNFSLQGEKTIKDKHVLLFKSNETKRQKVNDYVFNSKIVTHPDFVVHRLIIFMQEWSILLKEKKREKLDDNGNAEIITALGAIKRSVKAIYVVYKSFL